MGSKRIVGRPKVGINAHLLSGTQGYRRAGIHNYIGQLLTNLVSVDDDFELTVYCNSGEALRGSGLNVVSTLWPTEQPIIRILWEQLVWPLSAWQHEIDLLHSMAFVTPVAHPAPRIVTVYDLSFIHFPHQFPRLRRAYLSSQTRRSCRSARRIVAISEATRQDVHQHFEVPLERIDVVRPGVNQTFSPLPAGQVIDFRERQGLPQRFILHVGTLQPRKNLPLLLEAFAELDRDDIALVLVGGKGWHYERIFERVRTLGIEGQVHFPGYVPDSELPLWYNAAALLVFPSYFEGFGMPILEAMACGTPVIAARTSAIPEVTGDAALLFDPPEGSTLSEQMTAVLEQPEQAAGMRERGLLQAKHFSWQQAARAMLDVYRKALMET